MTLTAVSKIGPKGQIVLKKKLRAEAGLREGEMVEAQVTKDGILIKPFNAEKLIKSFDELATRVSAKWPKGLDSVEAVRRERR
ncbi:AbrB/MazE/SpoVT family DNA-binding domain-containing protein [Candidatus Woesearchaeota archaeon]|nr:AbrB/MazE/SpoVT family DNA-binding domain-containing protein [Candidatus Woesearchaeota archaeon]